MDDRRFDDITRLAAGASRRQAIKALGGSAAGGLLAFFGVRRGAAQQDQPDCCPADKPRLCDDRCVNLSTDVNNCGSCGAACRGNEICVDGQCARPARSPQSRCPSGTTECNGVCVDLNTDENNCGNCGTVCPSGETCQDGVCVGEGVCEPGQTRPCGSNVGECQPGTEICQDDGTWGPCEGGIGPQPEVCDGLDNDCDGQVDEDWDFESDPLNCGGCGNVCGGSGQCMAGTCQPICGDGFCDGALETCESCPQDCGPCEGQGFCDTVNCDDGNPCTIDSCDEANDVCVHTVVADGTICGPNGETCQAGSCTGTGPVCGDGVCDEGAGETCESCPQDCGPCEGQGLFCDTVNCDDGNPCTIDSCDEANDVCVHTVVADGTICGPNGETCQAGSCTGTGPVCGDGFCDEGAGETCDNCSVDCCPENQCDPGYERDGTTCVDIDECASRTAGCSSNATCTNTDGGFTCTCNEGFVGDGVTCTPDGSGGGGECTSNADCGTCGVCDGGICEPAAAGTVCRASAGVCDVAETCDGVSMDCPPDQFAASTTVCRAATSECDIAETCTGFSADCPSDTFVMDGTDCEGGTCQNGTCVQTGCPSGTTGCNGVCVDLNTDENNCGGCGNECAIGETCEGGICTGSSAVCGDGFCVGEAGETCESCPEDCGPCGGDLP